MRVLDPNPVTLWLTGLPASGKSTLAEALEARLAAAGRAAFVLDGDIMRTGLSRDLGFSAGDRHENIRRIAEVSKLLNRAGLIVIAALISPYRDDRALAKDVIGATKFIEVYLSTPLAVCEGRDPKGHYARARRGEIPDFTGVSAAYEAPENPGLTLDTSAQSVEKCVDALVAAIVAKPPH
jgi:adenylylsulfate kinase